MYESFSWEKFDAAMNQISDPELGWLSLTRILKNQIDSICVCRSAAYKIEDGNDHANRDHGPAQCGWLDATGKPTAQCSSDQRPNRHHERRGPEDLTREDEEDRRSHVDAERDGLL